jgi:hypothetical protein
MRVAPRASWLGVLLGVAGSAACHRDAPVGPADAASSAAPVEAEAPIARAVTLPARCQATGAGFALDDGRGLDDLEIGDAVATAQGLAVDVIHHGANGRVAAVALVPPSAVDGGALRVRDLAPTLGDAPPPRVAARGGDLLAIAYVVSKRPDARELGLFTIPAAGDVKLAGTLPEPRDDSLAFDLSSNLAVWDEARTGPVPRGVIRDAEIGADAKPGAPRDVSPPESDAELPRLAPMGGAAGGALVFWLARRPEATTAVDATPAEITGEARAYSWLEVVTVDGHGAPTGAARRLTSATGHVTSYDLQAPAAGSRDTLVVARDDGEAIDGSGGALLRVRVRADGQDPPVALPTDGLGRGAPAFVEGTPAWASWAAADEGGRLLALDVTGTPTGLPSVEPALDEGRPLAWLEQGRRLLIATPADDRAQLQVLGCASRGP